MPWPAGRTATPSYASLTATASPQFCTAKARQVSSGCACQIDGAHEGRFVQPLHEHGSASERRQLSKTYDAPVALPPLDLSIPCRSPFGIAGPNGGG